MLARLRALDGGWPRVDAIVITHWHLDHWGDLVPWVWGNLAGPGTERAAGAALAAARGPGADPGLRRPPGLGRHVRPDVRAHDYPEDEPVEIGGLHAARPAPPHYTLLTFGLRVTNGGHTLAYSGDCGPDAALADLARDVDLFVCEATLERGELDGTPRGHLSADEAVAAFEASGARRLLLTHRPGELPVEDGLELAYDGLVVEID